MFMRDTNSCMRRRKMEENFTDTKIESNQPKFRSVSSQFVCCGQALKIQHAA
jgi:hypothetical protein